VDDMGELVIKMGGQVMVLPKDKMPSETGLAAIFRYWPIAVTDQTNNYEQAEQMKAGIANSHIFAFKNSSYSFCLEETGNLILKWQIVRKNSM
jgi:hypothetical protein